MVILNLRAIALSFAILLWVPLQSADAHGLRRYAKKDGLSGDTIVSIYQDSKGLMWFGTNTGVNTFDGIRVLNSQSAAGNAYLAGDTVSRIFEGGNHVFWMQTSRGLHRVERSTGVIKTFKEFGLHARIAVAPTSSGCDIFIAKEDNSINYYRPGDDSFGKIPVENLVFDGILDMFVDKANTLWVFLDDGNHRCYSIDRSKPELSLTLLQEFKHSEDLLWCFHGDDEVYFVDGTLTLYEYNLSTKTKSYIQDINSTVIKNGGITSILKHHGDYYIGYINSGLMRIRNVPEHRDKYRAEEISFRPGVLSMAKDKFQDIVWIGTNGEGVYMLFEDNPTKLPSYLPPVSFTGLTILGEKSNMYGHLVLEGKRDVIQLNSDQNVFSITFAANDYIYGDKYTYFYQLNGQGDNWVNNGNSNTAGFTYLSPGKYTLSVKYRNDEAGTESDVYPIDIHILPNWYQTWWAYLLYFLVVCILVCIGYLFLLRYKRILLKGANRKYSDSLSRSKLSFFACMFDELYAPLALIRDSSAKILSEDDVLKQATIIRDNAERMESLVRDLNEVRILEAGERECRFVSLSVSQLADAVASTFIEQADARKIDYQIKISNGVYWVSDAYYLCHLLGNLLSDAFVHVRERGSVSVMLSVKETNLHIAVTYTGIKPRRSDAGIAQDFSFSKAIRLMEQHGPENSSTREDRLLIINCGIAQRLNGVLEVSDVPENSVTYTVVIPEYIIDPAMEEVEVSDEYTYTGHVAAHVLLEAIKPVHKPGRDAVLVVGNESGLFCLLNTLLGESCNLDFIEDTERAAELLATGKYALLVSKASMPGLSGTGLIRMVKANPKLSHIFCVLVASRNGLQEGHEAQEAGADYYITKPFDPEKMKQQIAILLQGKQAQSPSDGGLKRAFELGDEHFATDEAKAFYKKMLDILAKHVADVGLSVELLAEKVGCTTQQFYTRLKAITRKTPNEIIGAYRLYLVESLLVSTSLSIDEIAVKAGFAHPGNFSRLFVKTYGMTPKVYREQQKISLSHR